MKFIDTNHSFGRWPWPGAGCESATQLAELLEAEGIGEAWVAAVESLLAEDIEESEKRLQQALEPLANVRLVRTLNPAVAGAEKHCRIAMDDPRYAALRLAPTLHHYDLFDDCVVRLCEAIADGPGLPVQVLLRFDDERHRVPGLVTRTVAPLDLVCLAQRFPHLRFVAQGAVLGETGALAGRYFFNRAEENIWIDTTYLDHMDTLARAASNLSVDRLVFGTAEPFLYARANTLHFKSPTLSAADKEKIAWRNAASLLTPGAPSDSSP